MMYNIPYLSSQITQKLYLLFKMYKIYINMDKYIDIKRKHMLY